MKFQKWEKDEKYWREHVTRINSLAKGHCDNCHRIFFDWPRKDCAACGEELSQDNLYKK